MASSTAAALWFLTAALSALSALLSAVALTSSSSFDAFTFAGTVQAFSAHVSVPQGSCFVFFLSPEPVVTEWVL